MVQTRKNKIKSTVYYRNLFNNIVKAIPTNIFSSKDSINEAALDIYLTATGVRPGCIPFDGDMSNNGLSSFDMVEILNKHPEKLNKLKEIKEIKVIKGPYYDVGESYVVVNKAQLPNTQKILDKLEKIRINDKNPQNNGELHILMGKLLGYTCPMDLKDLFKMNEVYSIEFMIDDRSHMPVWCPLEGTHLKKTIWNQLNSIQKVLEPLNKTVLLKITKKKI
jgi:hypothetical protein